MSSIFLCHFPGAPYEISSASPETDSSSAEENAAASAASLALGRVYAATSLPAHIWSLNGKCESFEFFRFISKHGISVRPFAIIPHIK